jgi:hypothetical protein
MTIVVLLSGLHLWWNKRSMTFEQLLGEAFPHNKEPC